MSTETWACPKCGADNVDYRDTTFLLCGDCDKEFLWREVNRQMYMNPKTGSVDIYDGWFYEHPIIDAEVNAVDNGEVVPVKWDKETSSWVEV